MIEPRQRFWSEGQCYFGSDEFEKTETHCNVWDWDQLRMIKLKGTAKLFRRDEDKEIPVLAQFADYLSPDVRAVTVDDDGLLSGISHDPRDDNTMYHPYLKFSTVNSLAGHPTIRYSQIRELDRLGPGVDLSTYENEDGSHCKVAFKFNAFYKPRRELMAWDELHVLVNLPSHPNLVPFDRVVLEDVEARIIGHTTKFIPGGTLTDPQKPFRFEWLQQLTQVVDFLNLELGLMHQDIAPRNMIIDPDTGALLIFDFDWVAHGTEGLLDGRDDVTGVAIALYELITNDTQFSSIPHWDRQLNMVQSLAEWPCVRELDADVSVFRDFLNKWIATRQCLVDGDMVMDMKRYLDAPRRLTWPDLPTAPDLDVPFDLDEGQARTGHRSVASALAAGQYCFRWQRQLQKKVCGGGGLQMMDLLDRIEA